MKPWMKILMWLGIGFGIGFFSGEQVGQAIERKRNEEPDQQEDIQETYSQSAVKNILNEYSGEENNKDISSIEGIEAILGQTSTDAEVDDAFEMPTEEDLKIPDIPQLHPTQLVPELITEDEYYTNPWGYDKETMIFYEIDDVLYNESVQDIEQNPDDVVGIGTLFEFGGDPNNPIDTIYVKNETAGTLYRIDRLDEAYIDAVAGMAGPTDEDEPNDKTESDDFWDDV